MGESNDTIKGEQKLGQGAHEGRKHNKTVHECDTLSLSQRLKIYF